MRRGAIILCGGRSTRMGLDKATLPFGEELMLQRVVRLLSDEVDPMVVVAAREQVLPPLDERVLIARDRRPQSGPLEGLAVGLAALADRADAVYATSCDVPLLMPAFVERLFEMLGGTRGEDDWNRDAADSTSRADEGDDGNVAQYDIVVPREGKYHHPLSAVYRTSVLSHVEGLLADGRLRPVFLFDEVPTREVAVDELRAVDPVLNTLANLNRPADYLAALSRAGFTPPADLVARLGAAESPHEG